jgi:hypothetical protein
VITANGAWLAPTHVIDFLTFNPDIPLSDRSQAKTPAERGPTGTPPSTFGFERKQAARRLSSPSLRS